MDLDGAPFVEALRTAGSDHPRHCSATISASFGSKGKDNHSTASTILSTYIEYIAIRMRAFETLSMHSNAGAFEWAWFRTDRAGRLRSPCLSY